MSLCRFLRMAFLVVAFVGLVAGSRGLMAAEPVEWLRGTGKDLEIRLRGEVVNEKGEPEAGAKVSAKLRFHGFDLPIQATTTGNRFEMWLPVNRGNLWFIGLHAASADGQRTLERWLQGYELRQLAIDGLKIKTESPTRFFDVQVVQQGKPVADAWVKVGDNRVARAGADGMARIGLTKSEKLGRIMAWSDDRRIGGIDFSDNAEQDENALLHTVELSPCRDQKIRFVDEEGSPVAGVAFDLQFMTLSGKRYFVGVNENSRMKTDAKGEALYRWFPEWTEPRIFAEVASSQWKLAAGGHEHQKDGEFLVYKLKPARSAQRRPIQGQVRSTDTDVGGFYVTLNSFQSEIAYQGDPLFAFTDADGNFAADSTPNSTYCTHVVDARWVSDIVDVGPNDAAPSDPRKVLLTVTKGTKVDIQLTKGDDKEPYQNVPVLVTQPHRFGYVVNGRTQYGSGGPRWYVTTDEHGKATLNVPRGQLNVNVYETNWRDERTVNVESVEPVSVALHRPSEKLRTITGRIVLSEGVKASLAGAKVKIGAIDENTDQVSTVEIAEDGSFSLETKATEVGVFVRTKDGKAAGSAICVDVTKPIELVLSPTVDFEGQLLDADGKPRKGVKAWIDMWVGHEDRRKQNGLAWTFQGVELGGVTDENGNYTIAGVPAGAKFVLRSASAKDPKERDYEGQFQLAPDDPRPRTVSKLRAEKREDAPLLAGELESMLRDCPIMNLHLMVILANPAEKDFADRSFNDYSANPDVTRYLQIMVARNAEKLMPEDIKLMKERGWSMPQPGHVAAIALDGKGRELGKIDLEIARSTAAEDAAAFVRAHIPEKHDARQLWAEAFIEANRSGRRVFAVLGGRYCGPCFRLGRWMDKHHQLLEKDYIVVKVMADNDENSDEYTNRLTQNNHRHGVPFFAIYDKSGERLIDAAGPLGNVGYPSGFDGKKWFRKMLNTTRQQLTEADVEAMVGTIED